jgi:LysM repeat protein
VRFRRPRGKRKARFRPRQAALTAFVAGSIHAAAAPTGAGAAVPHVVQPGESLWSIAAANNFTTRTVAAFNGLPEDAYVIAGETIQIPTVEEGAAALAATGITPGAPASGSSAEHVIQPGETLSGIAAANGISTESLAAYNGIPADTLVIAGETIAVPGGAAGSSPPAPAVDPSTGLAYLWSPAGSVPLDPVAAESFEAMRQASLAQFGIDLYPDGVLSGYRTYEQQAYLYDLYLSGIGEPANPPGTSSHEYGRAVDLAEPVMRDIVDQIGAAYGWVGTYPSEWWHVEYLG